MSTDGCELDCSGVKNAKNGNAGVVCDGATKCKYSDCSATPFAVLVFSLGLNTPLGQFGFVDHDGDKSNGCEVDCTSVLNLAATATVTYNGVCGYTGDCPFYSPSLSTFSWL